MKDVEEKLYWIWFSMIPNVGIKRKQLLLEKYIDPKIIFYKDKNELKSIDGIGEKIAVDITSKDIKEKAEMRLNEYIDNNIKIISINDKEYPRMLKTIYDPPIVLFVKGNTRILKDKSIAIIGCREATEYGLKASKYFGYNLSRSGFNIVSGLARGIDSYSHIGNICAIEDQKNSMELIGKPIAVVGSGLDIVYPKENKTLEKKILNMQGAIISEYPLGTKPNKMNFPARNRIISGLSKGVLVIEAKRKSGTMLTVDFALEQGRDVFVVPGNINSINSVGTNELIKQGANVVTCYDDLL